MKRILQIIILNLFLIVVLTSFSSSQVTKTLLGLVAGPPSCSILENQPTNYFTLTLSGAKGFFMDNYGTSIADTGDIYFSRGIAASADVPTVIKCNNQSCGPWRSAQSAIYYNRPTTAQAWPNSFAEDINQPTHFFELWSGGAHIIIFRTAKDGSSRTLIYDSGFAGGGDEQVAFDKLDNRVVWCSIVWQTIWRAFRDGTGVGTWLPGFQPGAIGVFDDGRYVIENANNRTLRLHTAWSGILLQTSPVLPAGYAGNLLWLTVDNERNQAHIFREGALHGVWDIATNVFTSRTWTTIPGTSRFQGAYYKDWVYAKLGASSMCRYNWTTNVEEAWNGAQFLR